MIEGLYFDPWHGGCLRRIEKLKENNYKIHGVYGNDEEINIPETLEYDKDLKNMLNKYWHATLEIYERRKHFYYLNVNFEYKKGKKRIHYKAIYNERKRIIKWDDTNKWKQMHYHVNQLKSM